MDNRYIHPSDQDHSDRDYDVTAVAGPNDLTLGDSESDDRDLPAGGSATPAAVDGSLLGEGRETDPQVQTRLLNLSLRIERMDRLLGQMAQEVDRSGSQLSVLTRNLTDTQLMQPLYAYLADLSTRLQSNQEQLTQLAHTVEATAQREQFDELARTLKRMNRTQFKSNTLGETKEEQVARALTILQDILDGRAEVETRGALLEQQQRDDERRTVRAEFAADFLPALDGLELALENGQSLLARQRQSMQDGESAFQGWQRSMAVAKESAQAGVWQKLRRSLGVTDPVALPAPPESTPPAEPIQEVIDATQAWLDGLQLVHRRFLGLLAAEGIEEIHAQGQPFDPHLHVAVEMKRTDDAPPNTVVGVVRKGYRQHGSVLRYAEVVVSQITNNEKESEKEHKDG